MRLFQELIDFFYDIYILLHAIFSAWQCGKSYRIESRQKAKECYAVYLYQRWWKEDRSFNNFLYQVNAIHHEKDSFMHNMAIRIEKDEELMKNVRKILSMGGFMTHGKEVCKTKQRQLYREGTRTLLIAAAVVIIVVLLFCG